jgi:Reverse transcriptase (RNA-dependent DNA polymerase)
MLRLIGKWLKAGVLEEGHLLTVERGTPQGAVISPLLANIYLHYVYDLWVQRWRRRSAQGHVIVVRYADDMVGPIGCAAPAAKPAAQADVAEDDEDRGALAAQPEVAAPLSRLAVRRHDPRWEPGAVVPLAGICAGGDE